MKKLLVIANLHHASPRIPALLQYLADLGWSATVVTPDPGDDPQSVLGFPEGFLDKVDLAVAPYRGDIFWPLRKILNLFGFTKESSYTEQLKEEVVGGSSWVDRAMQIYQTLFAIPDTEWPWHRSAFKVASREIKSDKYDAILSSSPFPTVHRVASKLNKRYHIPWIADFRDPWSQSHNYTLPWFRQRFDRWLERRTICNADKVTTVSQGVAEKLSDLHGERVAVVRNGFQPIAERPEVVFPEKFTISYTGTIYSGKQDPNKILIALKRLLDTEAISPDRIAVEFYGRYDSSLQNTIDNNGLSSIVVQKGTFPRSEIRRKQMSSHLLLLLQWEDAEEKGIFPLKFYEYLDSRRPILATGGETSSELAELLKETGAGTVAIDVDEIVSELEKAYASFVSEGELEYSGVIKNINKYSYLGAAERLRDILEQVVSS